MKNFLRLFTLSIFSLAFYLNPNAQTVLVDPAGAGGFELGADMAANGWTTVNASTDGWFVGNTPVVATGNNCGFVSSGAGTTWTYSQTSTFTHIYRDFTVPAGESKITLSFKWKAGGEGAGTTDWDNMKIFLAPTSVTPITSSAVTGATQLSGPGSTSGMYKLNSLAWNNESFSFPATPGVTYRLIFSWKSDVSTVANPPAALDDISLSSQVPGTFISIITGNWNDPLTWDANAVPSAADNATVSTGHTVTVNATGQAINNLIVNGTLAYATTPTQFNVNGNLTVNVGGLVNVFNGTTGKTLFVSGNIVNDGTLNFSVGGAGNSATGAALLNLNGSTVQTINGIGSFTNNKIGSLTCSNTSTATPNINWQFDNIIIQHNLNLTGARFNLGNLTLSHGSSFNTTTGSMGLTAPAGTGFLPGAKYRRWYTTGASGSTISAGFDPTSTTSRFPFLNAAGTSQRWVHINRSSTITTGNTAGYLAVVYSDATSMTTGLSVVDGAYTVTDRYDGNWTVTAEAGYIYVSGTHGIAISANGAYPPSNGNSRVMLANTAMAGTHQNGTVTPTGQRVGLTTGQLTAGTLYLGIASADNQYPCVGTPNIPEALATTATSICPNGTVTMNATGMTTGFIGITNQWQVSSVSGGPYTNVVGGTGATTATHTTAAITTPGTYYYVLASTCTNSLTTSYS
ncbi:MAG: putative adhesin, partial [Bacteroidota bacterium]